MKTVHSIEINLLNNRTQLREDVQHGNKVEISREPANNPNDKKSCEFCLVL